MLAFKQATRQEELLTELEEELEGAQSKLQSKEEELEVWKDRVRQLMEGSLTSTSGTFFVPPSCFCHHYVMPYQESAMCKKAYCSSEKEIQGYKLLSCFHLVLNK